MNNTQDIFKENNTFQKLTKRKHEDYDNSSGRKTSKKKHNYNTQRDMKRKCED